MTSRFARIAAAVSTSIGVCLLILAFDDFQQDMNTAGLNVLERIDLFFMLGDERLLIPGVILLVAPVAGWCLVRATSRFILRERTSVKPNQ